MEVFVIQDWNPDPMILEICSSQNKAIRLAKIIASRSDLFVSVTRWTVDGGGTEYEQVWNSNSSRR